MGRIALHIFSPVGSLPEKQVDRIVTRSPKGECAVFPGHTAFWCSIVNANLSYEINGVVQDLFVAEGLFTIEKDIAFLFLKRSISDE